MVADIRQFLTGPTMPVMISTLSRESLGVQLAAIAAAAPSSAVHGGGGNANTAYFIPFVVSEPFTVKKIGVYNGATVAGNIDVGIYNESGTRQIAKGSTAQSGTNAVQEFDITDTTLQPGRYYMAIAASDATATFFQSSLGVMHGKLNGVARQATAFPLPSTATLAITDVATVPIVCVSGRTLVA